MAALLTSSGRPGFYFRVLEEGEVAAGDPILRISTGPQRMTVAEINALLYSSHHPRDQLTRALRIPALSPGWRWSFEALARSQDAHPGATGNAGLVPEAAAQTAAPGFRPLRVARIDRECVDVLSLTLQPTDGRRLTIPLAGQFVVLRLRPKPDGAPLVRSYSLSGTCLRRAVSRQRQGGAEWRRGQLPETATFERATCSMSANREAASPCSRAAGRCVLLSAGIGATPVLAMLHALAASATPREVWWLHGAHNSKSHSFATEARQLLGDASRGRSQMWYSQPSSGRSRGRDYDATGRVGVKAFDQFGRSATMATSTFAGHRASWAT